MRSGGNSVAVAVRFPTAEPRARHVRIIRIQPYQAQKVVFQIFLLDQQLRGRVAGIDQQGGDVVWVLNGVICLHLKLAVVCERCRIAPLRQHSLARLHVTRAQEQAAAAVALQLGHVQLLDLAVKLAPDAAEPYTDGVTGDDRTESLVYRWFAEFEAPGPITRRTASLASRHPA